MGDLKDSRLLYVKGGLFAVLTGLCAGLLYLESANVRTGLLLVLLVWASARTYYFLFYVLHSYVDPHFRYAGVWSCLRYWMSGTGGGKDGASRS